MKNIFKELSEKHGFIQVFNDFLEISTLAISNNTTKDKLLEREARYIEICKKYNKYEIKKFSHILAKLSLELEEKPRDVLGEILMELQEGNKITGQYLTPFHISELQSKLSFIDEKYNDGKIELIEPSCGGGAMIIAHYLTLKDKGINPQKVLNIVAKDLDKKSVFMCYVQMALLGIQGRVEHSNALSNEVFDVYRLPCWRYIQ
ncbi:SAM-dependent DNA methyltransferase [Clostridium perfringens]|nr:SAM-dependent DNA methyltransferase [Clostridium perfringens]